MTPEAVVRKFFGLAAKGDDADISQLLDPEVVWHGTRGGLDAGRVSHGAEAFLAYMREIEQTWDQFEVEVEQVIARDETVVAFLRETARVRGAIGLQSETAVVIKVRGGRIAEARGYLNRDEALDAAGLLP